MSLYHYDLPLFLSNITDFQHPQHTHVDSHLVFALGNATEKTNHTRQHNGWLSSSIVEHYTHFAEVCFTHFGDRVRHWITFHDPLTFCTLGYGGTGVFTQSHDAEKEKKKSKTNGRQQHQHRGTIHAPGRCSHRGLCSNGDSRREPYQCMHNVLLSHVSATHLYNTKFRDTPTHLPPGKISIVVSGNKYFARSKPVSDINYRAQHATKNVLPLDDVVTGSAEEEVAIERAQLFNIGWYVG